MSFKLRVERGYITQGFLNGGLSLQKTDIQSGSLNTQTHICIQTIVTLMDVAVVGKTRGTALGTVMVYYSVGDTESTGKKRKTEKSTGKIRYDSWST